ncbi:MAG: hypothetical protein JWQ64_618 [Subtercola sp.]|nr:hypothetical protein [Subtercola sp.]
MPPIDAGQMLDSDGLDNDVLDNDATPTTTLLPWQRQPGPVPPVRRHIGSPADGEPDFTNVFTGRQCLFGGLTGELI